MQGGSDSKNCGTRITKLRVVVEKIWLKEVFFGGGGQKCNFGRLWGLFLNVQGLWCPGNVIWNK
jgi:hypothetical protein